VFSLSRLLGLAVLGTLVYLVFYATPPGLRAEGRFDPEVVAEHEVAAWKALKGREEFGVYLNLMLALREHNRYSWFRAAEAAYHLGRATTAFEDMTTRYERALPDLEAAAAVEKAWTNTSSDPVAVARAQLTWWVTARMPSAGGVERVAPLVAEEYELRYRIPAGRMMDAAMRRAQATEMYTIGPDPDWEGITLVLTESYRSLQRVLSQPRRLPR
jgi:hypothetical protein